MPRKSPAGSSYPSNWPEITQAIKDAARWTCVRCGHPHDPANGYTLTVHHLDLCPDNCAWWNIPALCQRCHLHIQAKVVLERGWMFPHSEWFKPYVACYYAVRHGIISPTRDYWKSLEICPPSQVVEQLENWLNLDQTV